MTLLWHIIWNLTSNGSPSFTLGREEDGDAGW